MDLTSAKVTSTEELEIENRGKDAVGEVVFCSSRVASGVVAYQRAVEGPYKRNSKGLDIAPYTSSDIPSGKSQEDARWVPCRGREIVVLLISQASRASVRPWLARSRPRPLAGCHSTPLSTAP